jgi:serine/threonine-protein kinase
MVSVPAVIGETQAKATADLQAAGFTVSALNRTDAANIGKVVDTSPAVGSQQPKGSNITIFVGSAPGTSTTTSGTPTT